VQQEAAQKLTPGLPAADVHEERTSSELLRENANIPWWQEARQPTVTALTSLLRRRGTRRFADTLQNFLSSWDIEERLADMPPSFAAINIHKQSCVQRDVLTVHPGTAMR